MSVRFEDDNIEEEDNEPIQHQLNFRSHTMSAEDLARTRQEHASVDRIYQNQRRATLTQQRKAATLFKVTPDLINSIKAKDTKRSEWMKCYSERQHRRYWRHKATGMTSLERPYSNLDLGAESDSSEDSVDLSPSRKVRSRSPSPQRKKRSHRENNNAGENDHEVNRDDDDLLDLAAIHELDQGIWHERFSQRFNAKYWRNQHTRAVLWKKPVEYRSHR